MGALRDGNPLRTERLASCHRVGRLLHVALGPKNPPVAGPRAARHVRPRARLARSLGFQHSATQRIFPLLTRI